MIKARVTVTLKKGVLDPQGQAIVGALTAMNIPSINGVRQGKVFDVELQDMPQPQAKAQLENICEQLLANTVIEDYDISFL